MNKFLASIAIAAASTALVAPAYAAPVTEVNGSLATEIKTADLNLANVDGQRQLNRRIRQAAANVCSPFNPGRRMDLTTSYRDCVQIAVDNATAAAQPKIAAAISLQTKIAAR
jgi:UrcA family protein